MSSSGICFDTRCERKETAHRIAIIIARSLHRWLELTRLHELTYYRKLGQIINYIPS
jgi:hypothetical protein